MGQERLDRELDYDEPGHVDLLAEEGSGGYGYLVITDESFVVISGSWDLPSPFSQPWRAKPDSGSSVGRPEPADQLIVEVQVWRSPMGSKSRGRSEARIPTGLGVRGKGEPIDDLVDSTVGSGADSEVPGRGAWPVWARVAVSLLLLYHMAAVMAGAVGVPPSSDLEQGIADWFTPYFDLMDMGYSYRYYAEPPPTPVVTATLQFDDGRTEEIVRLPARNLTGPRMRHQRQLALANSLYTDVQEAKLRTRDASQSRLARAYARHLCRTRPGCRMVTLRVQQHLIPDPQRVREAVSEPGAPQFDLFAERMFTTPEWIGDYPCDAF
jgi:hypothetical protein